MSEVQSFEAQTGLVDKKPQAQHKVSQAEETKTTPQSNETTQKQQETSTKKPQDKKTSVKTQVEDSLESAPLFKKQYAQMEQHVNDSDQQRKDHQLNKVSQKTLNKLKR